MASSKCELREYLDEGGSSPFGEWLEDLDAIAAAKVRRRDVPLTRDFKETVRARAARDPKYRKALLREAVECLLAGDVDTGKAILRDYINATIGFEALSHATRKPAKSLMRMLGPNGNPQARNIFEVIAYLQRSQGWHFELALKG